MPKLDAECGECGHVTPIQQPKKGTPLKFKCENCGKRVTVLPKKDKP